MRHLIYKWKIKCCFINLNYACVWKLCKVIFIFEVESLLTYNWSFKSNKEICYFIFQYIGYTFWIRNDALDLFFVTTIELYITDQRCERVFQELYNFLRRILVVCDDSKFAPSCFSAPLDQVVGNLIPNSDRMDPAVICIHAYHVYDFLSIFYTSVRKQKYLSRVTLNYFLPEQFKQGSVNPSSTHISFHLLNHFNGTPNCGRIILLAAWKHAACSASKTDNIKITIFGKTLQKEDESLLCFCHSFAPH